MKSIVVLFLAFALGLECFSQQGQPIVPYNENGYSINEVKEFALASTELSFHWRNEMIRIVNSGLLASGENLIVDGTSIGWILNQISYEEVELKSFTNSRRFGNRISFYKDQNFRGTVGVFKYGKCKLILFKTICMNLLETDLIVVEQFTATQQQDPIYVPAYETPTSNGGVTVNVNCNCPQGQQQQNSNGFRSGVTFIPDEPYYQRQPYYAVGGYYDGGVNYYSQNSYYSRPQQYGVVANSRGNYSPPRASQQVVYQNSGSPRGVSGNRPSGGPSGVPGNGPSGVPGNGR